MTPWTPWTSCLAVAEALVEWHRDTSPGAWRDHSDVEVAEVMALLARQFASAAAEREIQVAGPADLDRLALESIRDVHTFDSDVVGWDLLLWVKEHLDDPSIPGIPRADEPGRAAVERLIEHAYADGRTWRARVQAVRAVIAAHLEASPGARLRDRRAALRADLLDEH